MGNIRKLITIICIVLVFLNVLSGCALQNHTPTPFNESYEYTCIDAFYPRPSFVNAGIRMDSLSIALDDGIYICFTTESETADDFINSQRSLLRFLMDSGVEVTRLKYYATNYDDSFSDSGNNSAYISLSAKRTYQQILVTLQALWGDYTDFGYVYAVSNAIADELGWQTDRLDNVDEVSFDSFFSENPSAINLLYPCFSTDLASEETVNCCKVLSNKLFAEMDLHTALKKSIEDQLDDFNSVLSEYARKKSIPFNRQTCGYAYYGEYLPLRISTTYAQLMIDKNFSDYYINTHEDYFSDYASIYQTANFIDREITEAVEHFRLEDSAGKVSINWLSGDSAEAKYGRQLVNHYNSNLQEVTVTTITGYLHEYYHHIAQLMNPDLGQCWQSQAFCEIGRSHSRYAQYVMERSFTQNAQWSDLFYQCTGRTYQPGVNDYFEAYDILCYVTGEYSLDYYNGRNGMNSFSHYLIDLYGEDAAYNVMLYPETVEDATGKTWVVLEAEWKQHIHNKYAGVEIDVSWLEY